MLRSNTLKYIVLFIMLVLIQVLILNRISLFGYGIPFVYIYFVLKLPLGCNRGLAAFSGFLIGFTIDLFCNTPGLNAAATTMIGFVCRPVQKLFFTVDDYNDQMPSISSLGSAYVKYMLLLVLVHHVFLISVESFSYFNPQILLLRIVISVLLTSLLLFAFEGFYLKKKNSWRKTT
ncbi:rod shape-determining protein MreD [Dysgonomonas sp.]|jgi:rod shape-determining protein MreD|nr:rod shape-determining protein MreD [Prevotella sp.]